MFLIVFLFASIYFFLIERYRASLLIMLPALLLYFFVAAFQYGVGTDYFSYVEIYQSEEKQNYYYNKGELLFFGLNQYLNWMDLPAQSIFIAISFIQSLLIFVYFKKIKTNGIILWLFFVIFFTVTNIYNNQLNLLRQFVVVALLPILTFIVFERRWLKFLIVVFIGYLFHASALFLLFMIPIYFLQSRIKASNIVLYFILSAGGYYYLGGMAGGIVKNYLQAYQHYVSSELAVGFSLMLFITKLYYLPVFLYFFLTYKKQETMPWQYLHFMVVIFSMTYWFFLLSLSFGIAERLYYYLTFFYIFPIYYLLHRSIKNNNGFEFTLLFTYIVLPYFAKVTFLARGEYLYNSVLFN